VPGAMVTADAVDSVTLRTAISDGRGETALRQLDPSAGYVLTVALSGFRTAKRPDVLVRAGQTTTLRVGLVVGSLSEELTVTSETPLVDTTSAVTGQGSIAFGEAMEFRAPRRFYLGARVSF